MKRVLFIILFLLYSIFGFSQRYDSLIIIDQGVRIYKTIYGLEKTEFYQRDTLGNWVLKFRWRETPNDRWYIRIDSGYIESPVAYETFNGDTITSYFVDTLGNMELSWISIYYKDDGVPTYAADLDDDDDIIVTSYDKTVTIRSKKNIENVEVIDISGRSIKYVNPNNTISQFKLFEGFYIIKIKTERGKINKKVVVH